LFLESTYGDTLTHRSFSDARTDLYNEIKAAHKQDVPVLIPTFGVGRAQEILQLIRERESDLAGAVDGTPTVVYDGLITDSLPVYEVFCQAEYMGESIVNYKMETGDAEPFAPDCATTPDTTADRESLLRGDDAPIIIAPSGMLTGGWSPYYLRDLSRHYDDARVIFTGYQAEGTPGRQLLEAPGDRARLQVRALPAPEDYDAETEDFEFRTHEIAVPTDWIRNIRGMSGHAAGNTLLQFARDAAPTAISLVHGPPAAAAHLEDHLDSNTDAESVEIASHRSEIQVGESGAVAATVDELLERQNRLENELAALREDIQNLKEEREM
jgi:predicted metal-dependent RNase